MSELRERVVAYNTEIKAALQAVYNDLNQGQRKKLLRTGQRIDIPLHHENKLYPLRPLSAAEMELDFILEPFAPLSPAEIRALCAAENRNILATFLPE